MDTIDIPTCNIVNDVMGHDVTTSDLNNLLRKSNLDYLKVRTT